MAKRQLKTGVRRGGGPPPGYHWTVMILDVAYKDATGMLTEAQYQHIVLQLRELAMEQDPGHSKTASIDAIEDYHELRDKGGVFGKLNIRVFFYIDKRNSSLIILGIAKKQNDGQTPQAIKIVMARRKRLYTQGAYSSA